MPLTAAAEIPYPHIELSARGIPFIAGTTMKVIELVMAQEAHGWSPEELHFQFPHLSMSQIHGALTYYWDHRFPLDEEIERRLSLTDVARQTAEETALLQRLRAEKRLAR